MKAFSLFALLFAAFLIAPDAEARYGQNIYLEVDRHAEHLPLKRMLRRQAGFVPDGYRLTGVTLHRSKRDVKRARRHGIDAGASLAVGRYGSGYCHALHGRNTFIPAPRHAAGRWQVQLNPGTRVRGVTPHLKPERRHLRQYRSDRHHRDWAYAPRYRRW